MKRIYIDNDIGLKLAHYGLLYRLVDHALGREYELFTLHSLKYIAETYADERDDISDKQAFMEQISYLVSASKQPEIGITTIQSLQEINHPDIDAGELTLIGSAIDNSGCVATGDKRAITAVHKSIQSHNDLAGLGFLTLEQTLRMTIELFGEDAFNEIVRCGGVDKAVKACCNSGCQSQALMGLESYIGSISKACDQFNFCKTPSL